MLAIDIDRAAVGRLDDWARNRYLKLVSEVGEREFKREEAEEVLIKGIRAGKRGKALFSFKGCGFDRRDRG